MQIEKTFNMSLSMPYTMDLSHKTFSCIFFKIWLYARYIDPTIDQTQKIIILSPISAGTDVGRGRALNYRKYSV